MGDVLGLNLSSAPHCEHVKRLLPSTATPGGRMGGIPSIAPLRSPLIVCALGAPCGSMRQTRHSSLSFFLGDNRTTIQPSDWVKIDYPA
jgi:hypothetical protein